MVDQLAQRGMISDEDFHLYKITDDVEEARDDILGFYRVYHSMRYVGEQLVIRCRETISDDDLAALNAEFSDILEEGEIRRGPAFPEEATEPELAELERLVLQFDRRSHGRLRMLINRLNQSAAGPRRSLSS